MNDEFDLDIENYELEDILNLFKLQYNFVEDELKKAYRVALKLHPDKSKLSGDYFRFYMKAYKIVEKVFYFRQQRKKSKYDTIYNATETDTPADKAVLLHSLNGKSIQEFNQWFNKMFETVKVKDEEDDSGYNSWIKNNKVDDDNKKVALSDFGRVFEAKKKEGKDLVKHQGVREMGVVDGGYNLVREKVTNYSSGLFSKLPYEDFKKAHTETVIPVTHQDFLNKEKFSSLETYKKHRDSQDFVPPSLQQSQQYLAEREKNEGQIHSRRAFKILKRDEELEKSNEKWWSNLQRLKG
uniref:J domain-containing protein n=1 Tax=viral metagenome TaxID=1070528 RepID=A0A6C0ELV4_9ZZZZ